MGLAPSALWAMRGDDVDWLLASRALEPEYGQYGEWLPEAINPAANPTDYSSGYHFVGEGPEVNWAEKAVEEKKEAHYKEHPDASRAGERFWVRKVTYAPVESGTVLDGDA